MNENQKKAYRALLNQTLTMVKNDMEGYDENFKEVHEDFQREDVVVALRALFDKLQAELVAHAG